ncbi:putative inositol polyphosphate 5-phosphatase C9G1.10c [Cyphellophora attinorum]|uniref:Putative inositol polyphosphate 5-phosphatase C9G1.10c n=1 Tax=Cyphellophora attinorum TaxID=1664694 RepID=A0A0N1NW63_9EURO|nr:putative inositol polyphosphate 5-phosphatase C9G1.10c [Phialophora attinorum]KPI35023.1 putative inositol polyphosphate 5-phosphatase C9G1.10c [Phialophora attinorum]
MLDSYHGQARRWHRRCSIRPVSSLRAKFEGLKASSPARDGAPSPVLPSPGFRSLEPDSSVPTVRASFDLSRPTSPWPNNGGQTSPKTPGDRGRSSSPPKSGHKRPMSMVMQGSPHLGPSVKVDSPKSPPRMHYGPGVQLSPAHADTPPVGKVKDLVSQHTSRSASPATTPHIGPQSDFQQPGIPFSATLSQAKGPPPINRAEKPRIPTKPAVISHNTLQVNDAVALQPSPRRASSEARISPFSTPPSSDEDGSPPNPPNAQELSQSLKSLPEDRVAPTPPKSSDPRSMGFARTSTAPVRDPRALGFGKPDSPQPSRDVVSTSAPSRANTVSERPVARDPRGLGFSGTPTPRHVSEQIRHTPPPLISPPRPSARDARTLGFDKDPVKQDSPREMPTRHVVRAPPSRPLDDSKNTMGKPATKSQAALPDRSTKPGAVQSIAKAPPLPAVNPKFPPPPKRNNTDGDTEPPLPRRSTANGGNDSDEAEEFLAAPTSQRADYPDATQTNRRPPFFHDGIRDIHLKTDCRSFDVCGRYLCTAGYTTRVFDMASGEGLTSINHGETVKATAAAFKPSADLESEGKTIWIGNNVGDLLEIDVFSHTVLAQSSVHNKREIVQILRHKRDLWTLDDDGKLFVWQAVEEGGPELKYRHLAHKVQKGHSCSLVVGDHLWLATGKDIRVYRPGNEAKFAPLSSPLSQAGTGDVTCAAYSDEQGGLVYFGHTDGKITIYSAKDFSCLNTVKASDYKINALAAVGTSLWAAYKTGKIYVYDTSKNPWKVQKDWRAHDGPVSGLVLDSSSVWTMQRLQIVSIGQDGHARLWDGMLEEDWLENAMKERDVQYCTFREVSAAVVSWNAGAVTPYDLRTDFIADAIHCEDPPEVLIFGFQEVVDLEDRTVTAKSLFGFGKKKHDTDSSEQHQSRVYREWRDYLSKVISRSCGNHRYSEVHMSSLVGLFQCVFIRQEERANLQDVHGVNVKCGMKGHYGNKGALITRFTLDDSSLCFINCHLAAGQSHTSHRNNDITAIMESENLPAERNPDTRMSLYVGGGDGTQILDHEICILNGDLNYRIDSIPRDRVVQMVKNNDLAKLLERDQLLVSRRRVAGFRLASFIELPLTFAPTYKYDVGTDNYDSSDKKRAPAWCDRLLYRGPGRVKQVEYRRHEVRVSDHRPVSGLFKIRLKKVDPRKRAKVKEACLAEFAVLQKQIAARASQRYLVEGLGVSESEAKRLLAGV